MSGDAVLCYWICPGVDDRWTSRGKSVVEMSWKTRCVESLMEEHDKHDIEGAH